MPSKGIKKPDDFDRGLYEALETEPQNGTRKRRRDEWQTTPVHREPTTTLVMGWLVLQEGSAGRIP